MRNDLSIYRTYAANWWDGSQRFLRLLQNLVPARLSLFDEVVDTWHGETVLDLGCGGGFMAVVVAKAHAGEAGLAIDYRVGSGEAIPLADGSVDCVVCVDVLEHVADIDRVLDEIVRVLKPDGLFLFDTINRTRLAAFVIVHLGESVLRLLPRGTHDPAKFIAPAELAGALVARGFRVGPFVGLGPCGLNRRLDFTFGRLPSVQIMYAGHARAPADTFFSRGTSQIATMPST
jgi:2-polyprenyl-6-hydroxyphenyl methylase/3-demethylubiquinone-9 3-methyltransferase